jgi:hypothetical protein
MLAREIVIWPGGSAERQVLDVACNEHVFERGEERVVWVLRG